jgi:uncharacterized protein (TIGR04255 family)
MALDLPVPDKTPLRRSPLQLVVCQVRFDEIFSVNDPRAVLALHKALGGPKGKYPKSESIQIQMTQVQVGPGGPEGAQTLPPQGGRRFKSQDDLWTITLLPTHVALETTAYTSWEGDFQNRLFELIDAIDEHIGPTIEERIGLRYINQLTEPTAVSPGDWHGYVAAELLGVILHPAIGPGVSNTLNQVNINFGEGLGCLLRHGAVPDPGQPGKTNYMLDLDTFRQQPRDFLAQDIKSCADELNDLVLRLFQQSITPELYKFLKEG